MIVDCAQAGRGSPGRSWNCVGSGKWNWKQQLATGKCTPEKYVTNLSRPDNSNNNENRREHTHTQTTCAAHFGLSQEVYVAVSPGWRDVDVDENVESKLRVAVAVAVVGVKVPLKCFQRIHKTVKEREGGGRWGSCITGKQTENK